MVLGGCTTAYNPKRPAGWCPARHGIPVLRPEVTPCRSLPESRAVASLSRTSRVGDFPLGKHPRGYWCKKVRGKLHYFGRIESDPDGQKALEQWLNQKDDLLAGRTPRVPGDELTVGKLCSRFLDAKYAKLQSGELSPRSFADCKMTTDRVVRVFGKNRLVDDLAADDFAELRRDIAKTRNPESVGNEINRIRGVFRFGSDARVAARRRLD